MSDDHVDVHHLAAAYALDAVDDGERRAFEAHYHSCEVCRADVTDHRETLGRVAAASPTAPSPEVKDRVLAEVARTRQLSPLLPDGVGHLAERRRRRRRRRTVAGTLFAAAAAVVLFVAGAVLVDLGAGSDFGDELAAVLDDPDARWLTLPPDQSVGANGSVRVAWSPATGRAAVLGDGLSPAPTGEAYELWLIDDSGPRPMRLLDPADDGGFRGVFDIAAEPAAWGVTVEPDTGSDAPTGDILFLAEA